MTLPLYLHFYQQPLTLRAIHSEDKLVEQTSHFFDSFFPEGFD